MQKELQREINETIGRVIEMFTWVSKGKEKLKILFAFTNFAGKTKYAVKISVCQ